MPFLEAPINFDDESSPDNSMAADLAGGNNVPAAAQIRIRTPEPRPVVNNGGGNNFGGFRLPTIRLHNQRTFAQAQAAAAPIGVTTTAPSITRRGDIFAELEAEVHNAESWSRLGPAPPPVVNLLPVTLPPQAAEPQLDELLRRVTQRNDLQNVETVRLRVISAITVSLSRLALFLPRLQHLDLSGSVLCSLRDLGCGLIQLAHLNVSNCGLNSFDGTSGMPSIRVLIADGNMIQRVGPLAQLPLLQRLSAQNNRISDLGLLTFLAMCPNLVEVELQGNPVCHLQLYRLTLQRSVRTLRLIDGVTVSEYTDDHSGDNVHINVTTDTGTRHEPDESTEATRVATLNRRNALLFRAASTTSTTSTQSSSSMSGVSSGANNTTSDNEAFSSLSSEYQAATDDIDMPVPVTPPPEQSLPLQQQSSSHATPSSSSSSSPFSPAAPSAAAAAARISFALTSLAAMRRLNRPATAPAVENTQLAVAALNNRPVSASIPEHHQQPVLAPGAATSSVVAGSVLDLVRRQRGRLRREHNRTAWMSASGGSNSSTSSLGGELHSADSNRSSEGVFSAEL